MSTVSPEDALQRFETIWAHVECGITIVDAATRTIVAVNPVAARMFGDDASKILGKICHKFICPAEKCSCPIMDLGQTVDRSERKFVKADGGIIPIIKSVAKIQYNGRLALLESFTDISNLKAAEEKVRQLTITEEANRAKSDFLSRMSHEMRTPMNAIIGMTKIAEESHDIDKLRYCLSMIDASSKHLLGLINDVLDMSKIEAGKFELDCAPLNVERILIRICNLVLEKVEKKGISLDVSFAEDMDLDYLGDELRLSQVVANLMSNAVKFTPPGGRISIRVEGARGSEDALVRFSVADTGIGMTQTQSARLFHAFEQADASIFSRFGGTGLGLAISKAIVEKMQGSIRVESEAGTGSVFSFEVRLGLPEPGYRETPVPDVSGVRILVADSDEAVRNQFAALARRYGFEADTAVDSASALACIEAAKESGRPYRRIFIEHALPGFGALGTLATAGASVEPDSVVLLTSLLCWNADESGILDCGVRHFLTRPLFSSLILEAVAQGSPESATPESPTLPDTADFSGLSLLLAEDVDINREIFMALLEKTGITIECAENGREALEMFTASPERYDMIVMDVQMPVMDGYEATRAIRASACGKARTIPIIALTANVFKTDIEKCLGCGMNGHLAKPVDANAVIATIQKFRKAGAELKTA